MTYRDGKVISIRDDIETMVKSKAAIDGPKPSSKKNVIVAETHVVAAMMSKASSDSGEGKKGEPTIVDKKNVTTLAIKSSNGGQTLIVKLLFTDTVAQV